MEYERKRDAQPGNGAVAALVVPEQPSGSAGGVQEADQPSGSAGGVQEADQPAQATLGQIIDDLEAVAQDELAAHMRNVPTEWVETEGWNRWSQLAQQQSRVNPFADVGNADLYHPQVAQAPRVNPFEDLDNADLSHPGDTRFQGEGFPSIPWEEDSQADGESLLEQDGLLPL